MFQLTLHFFLHTLFLGFLVLEVYIFDMFCTLSSPTHKFFSTHKTLNPASTLWAFNLLHQTPALISAARLTRRITWFRFHWLAMMSLWFVEHRGWLWRSWQMVYRGGKRNWSLYIGCDLCRSEGELWIRNRLLLCRRKTCLSLLGLGWCEPFYLKVAGNGQDRGVYSSPKLSFS